MKFLELDETNTYEDNNTPHNNYRKNNTTNNYNIRNNNYKNKNRHWIIIWFNPLFCKLSNI